MKTNLKNTLIAFLLLAVLLGQFFLAPQTARAAAVCDAALFVADVTVPDGSIFPPSTPFVKTWRLKNVGTCAWTTSYKLVFAGGSDLSAPEATLLPTTVAPGATVDLSLNMVSLAGDSTYRGYWQLMNAAGARFGIGPNADKFFWVEIVVRGGIVRSTPTPTALPPVGMSDDFVASAGAASWQSGAGKLTFPGLVGDTRGFVRKLDTVKLETGETISQPSLLMTPQNKTDGYIQGFYPALAIQNGDRFQATVGCQYWAKPCYVTYRIDYRTSAGIKTLWTFKEKYDGLTYNVNIDLSFLAGKNVEFFLMVLASGSPSGDQALWVAPRIVRATPIPPTPSPTDVLTPTATTPRLVNATIEVDQPVIGVCGRSNPVNVVATVTTLVATTVTYHWQLVADKTIITPDESLVFNAAGAQTVSPAGYGADCGINYLARIIITSPSFWSAGIYYSVVEPTSTPLPLPTLTPVTPSTPVPAGDGTQFATNGGAASWRSGAGTLSFPGVDGDARGFALKLETFQMETGAFVSEPSLLMVPQAKTDGYIQGLFPPIAIQNGDRFQATVGCQYGATSCYVTFRIDVRTSAGIRTLWTFRERYDGLAYNVNLDLSSLAGKNAEFFLLVLASGSASGDRAVWIAPRIVRSGGPSPSATATLTPVAPAATSTPTAMTQPATATATPVPASATPTPAHVGWLRYTDTTYQFEFQYPPGGAASQDQASLITIGLPVTPGTNLTSKYLQVAAVENASVCTSLPVGGTGDGQPVTFNGIAFTKETGQDRGAGQIRDWTNYYTVRGTTCISMGFVLHSGMIGAFPTPIVEFDSAAESAVIGEIMSTFGWLAP